MVTSADRLQILLYSLDDFVNEYDLCCRRASVHVRGVWPAIHTERSSEAAHASAFGRSALHLQRVCKDVRLRVGAAASHDHAHGRQAIRVCRVQPQVWNERRNEEAYADAHWRAAVPLRRLQEELFVLGASEKTSALSPTRAQLNECLESDALQSVLATGLPRRGGRGFKHVES